MSAGEFVTSVENPYINQVEGVTNVDVTGWFTAVCAQEIGDAELLTLPYIARLGGFKDPDGYASRTAESIAELPQGEKTARLMHDGVIAVVQSPSADLDTKLTILTHMSKAMYEADRPVNGKLVVLRHVRRYHSAALSYSAFGGAEEVYKDADTLLLRAQSEIPRTKSRTEVFQGIFKYITGSEAPSGIFAPLAGLAVDAVIDAKIQAERMAARAEGRTARRDQRKRVELANLQARMIALSEELYPDLEENLRSRSV